MLEVLVAALCIGNFRCDQATKAYFTQYPMLKDNANSELKVLQKDVIKVVGEQTALGAAIVIAAATQKTYQIKLSKSWSIGVSRDVFNNDRDTKGAMLMYGMEF